MPNRPFFQRSVDVSGPALTCALHVGRRLIDRRQGVASEPGQAESPLDRLDCVLGQVMGVPTADEARERHERS